jgi:hypothetical protein
MLNRVYLKTSVSCGQSDKQNLDFLLGRCNAAPFAATFASPGNLRLNYINMLFSESTAVNLRVEYFVYLKVNKEGLNNGHQCIFIENDQG